MQVNGTLINYYFHCKRQCYLHGNRLNLEDNSEIVKIGKAIIDRLSGKETESDLIYKTVYDKIDNLSTILEIESIVDFEKTVPIYIANRPLNM